MKVYACLCAAVVMLVMTSRVSEARSTGAPLSACRDMMPQHNATAQTSPPPYTITTDAQSVAPGDSVEVVIAGKLPEDTLRGYLLQARQGDDILGTFSLEDGDVFSQLINCGKPGNAVTHKKHDNKEDKRQVRVRWSPPQGLTGEVVFRATIVKTLKVFWVGVQSAPIKIVS
ncbi:putative defense protein [Bombyx mandarina]|uniref:Putative defense protein n=3 Tax=Bombyx TaxID=7090 RepID=DFP_BOMMO|nr:putative defense protein precursor [Bombyx mori]XP_012546644.1 putative defense protein isoform X1 [Bombyx mori]XP_028043041.1 putative defense protein [Bombyx mandarina]XP_028043049.1 putative defense protein [Bombyx mandarina]Q008X1.1 RecName: Full=Putative defense protein; Flags: Precursor [Bombyx mori]ABJ09465.1 immune-related protein [Bombyx mori]ADZ40416.1 Immune-related protein 1 [Bombyx mori]